MGGHQVLAGRISVGSFVMFNTYMGMLVWPMIALGWVVNLMQRGSASLQRINEILREQPSIAAPPDPVSLGAVRGEIEFRDVTVDYGSGPALNAIDLRIPAGTTLAVVGHTGSGKSTLVNLLPRLFDPTRGAVLLDGIDLRRADPAELRRHIGFVPQETFLFSATIAGNIAFGVERRHAEQIRRAAEMAGLAGDIEGFPLGYDTHGGRTRHHPLGRAETAHRDRARDAARPANSDSGRCPVGGRYADRGAHPHASGGRDAGPHRDPDFAPRFHRAAGRLASWCWSAAGSSSAARTTNWSRPADTTRSSVRSKCWKKSWKPSSSEMALALERR